MKISTIANFINFKGRREDRNTTSQLAKNNDYSLTENNRRKIKSAIQNLGNETGADNIEFLLDVAKNLQYGTNIDTGVGRPDNDWMNELRTAAERSLAASDPILKEKFASQFNKIFDPRKPLSVDEKEILGYKDRILAKIDKTQLEGQKNKNITNIEGNLNYFIASSNIPLKQKKYILNRFEFLLSPDYSINPQLEDKKTLVLAEMLNDLVVDTHTGEVPNTKAINQKQHGMCAAISIARKLMSYEYKANYVDSILSELDDSRQMMVYDLANIGSGKKISIQKPDVDYQEALDKGYRIVDAATTVWMNAADMYGMDYKSEYVYTPFDASYFGTFQDSHFMKPIEDTKLVPKHSYYQSLLKAKEHVNAAKASKLISKYDYLAGENRLDSDLKLVSELNASMMDKLSKILPSFSVEQLQHVLHDVNSLSVTYSLDIDKKPESIRQYCFIPNEQDSVKKNKIADFIKDNYKQAVDESQLGVYVKDLLEISEMLHSINNSIKPKTTASKKVAYDRKLYNAAASYRTAVMFALKDWDIKRDYMVHFDIPDESTLLLSTLGSTVEHIEKTNDPLFLNHYATVFGVKPVKEQVIPSIEAVGNSLELSLTKTMDELYAALGIGDRKTALLNAVRALKYEIEHGNQKELENSSIALGIEKDKNKVLQIYDEFERILSSNPSEQDYVEIFNSIGNKSILYAFAQDFEVMLDAINNPKDEVYRQLIQRFNHVNGLPDDAPLEYTKAILSDIGNKFNVLSVNLSTIRDIFTIVDDKGNLITSAVPSAVVLKKLEDRGTILSIAELWPLKKRYDAIDKLRSQDEFSSRQGKISDPSLYKYSAAEKKSLKKINGLLNYMASEVNKELVNVYREIKVPLKEHARQIGVNTGSYWNAAEGSSGLYSHQQLKILQELTGKPYQAVNDLEKAVDIIKNSPHSGISSTSVFHDKPGWHAQYVSEISEKDGKDILFHDNSWGAAEHENVWVDSEGLVRTDYSDNRGGELGYITDKKWRNGNYIENLTLKTGFNMPQKYNSKIISKLKNIDGDDEEYNFPLISRIILPGVDAQANELASGIKDTIFLPEVMYIPNLKKLASEMTVAQIKAAKTRSDSAGFGYKSELKRIEQRLKDTPFAKTISNKSEFDALPDDDELRVVFEKAALILSYEYTYLNRKLADVNSVSEINKLREKRRKIARENFNYAFAKSPEVLFSYFRNRNKSKLFDILNKAFEDNGIKPDSKTNTKISQAVFKLSNAKLKEYDGSLKNAISIYVDNLLTLIDDMIPASSAREAAKNQIKKELTADLRRVLYFNAHDLEKDTEKFNAIKKFIDRKYNPKTDEEFIQIYKKLQDMPLKEFMIETADVKDEDMAFKNLSGFSVLQKYRATNEEIRNLVTNIIFQKYFYNDLNISKTEPSFKYKKLEKKIRGAFYSEERTYDDLYRNFKFTLSELELEKVFNKYSDVNYRKYSALPAYPKINVLTENKILEMTDRFDGSVNDKIEKIKLKKQNLHVYELTQRVSEFLNSLQDEQKLTEKQRKILYNYAGEFITNNYVDETIPKSRESALNILEMENPELRARDYKEQFRPWFDEIEAIRKLNGPEVIKQSIKDDITGLRHFIEMVVNSNFSTKYRSAIKNDINNWLNEELKYDISPYDKTLVYRNLEEKISGTLLPAKDPKIKDDFLNDLIMHILNLKKLQTLQEQNTENQLAAYEFMLNELVSLSNKFLSENQYKELGENIYNYLSSENKLSKSDVREYILSELSGMSNIEKGKLASDTRVLRLINSAYNYYKIDNGGYRLDDNMASEKHLLKLNIEKFVENNIQPNYKDAVRIKVREYLADNLEKIGKNKYSEEKAALAHEKFIEDYKKYHILNYPEEILDRYTMLLAKDGVIATEKNPEQKVRLNVELEQYDSYLNMALSLANLAEVQGLLMEAVGLGNPSVVASKFKNFDTSLFDDKGSVATMADPEAVDYMVRRLIVENDDNTAVLFVEKLGLTEKFLKIEDEYFDFKDYKSYIDKIGRAISNASKQIEVIDQQMGELVSSIRGGANTIEEIEHVQRELLEKTKKFGSKTNIKKVVTMLDGLKPVIESNPDIAAEILVEQGFNFVKSGIISDLNTKLKELKIPISEAYLMFGMISKLSVKENSEEERVKNHIMQTYNKIEEYNDKVMSSLIAKTKNLSIDIQQM